jgi:hypothetical protein
MLAQTGGWGMGRPCPLCPGTSDINLFRYCQSIIHFDAKISDHAFDFGVAEPRLYGSSQGNDLKTTGPEVCHLVIFAACYFDFAAGYFVRWPASKSVSAMTNCRGD